VEAALDEFLVTEGMPVNVFSGTDELKLQVYPTLFNNTTNVILSSTPGFDIELKITDINGKILQRSKIAEGTKILSVGEQLKKGVYILQFISNKGESRPFKIIKY
jgi:hypothetical protein